MDLRTTLAPLALGLALAACGNDTGPVETDTSTTPSETADETLMTEDDAALTPGFTEPSVPSMETGLDTLPSDRFAGDWVLSDDPATTVSFVEEDGTWYWVSEYEGEEQSREAVSYVVNCDSLLTSMDPTDYFMTGEGEEARCYYIVSSTSSDLVLSEAGSDETLAYIAPVDVDTEEMDLSGEEPDMEDVEDLADDVGEDTEETVEDTDDTTTGDDLE